MASKLAKAEPIIYNNKVIRIVMVGKTGVGKSATANTILGGKSFLSKFSIKSVTTRCAKADGEVDGQKVAIIDTPGLFDTNIEEKKTSEVISESITYASPGPHIFLVVIKLGRFTEEEKKAVKKIQEIFGQDADKYSMVLFTHGDQLEGESIEECLKESEDLQELVARCNNQYHVFDNKLKDRSQVSELLKKIRNITEKNGGSHYTNEMFQKAERAIEEEKQRILKEKEEQTRKEREEMERKINEKYGEELRKMKDDMEREMKDKCDQEIKKIKDDMESREMEREMEERKDKKRRKVKYDKEREDRERKLIEKYEEDLRRMEADRQWEDQLKAAQQRELEEENRKLREKQEQDARQEAENSDSVLSRVRGFVSGVFEKVWNFLPFS